MGLPILNDAEAKADAKTRGRDRRDGAVLTSAQALVEAGKAADAAVLLEPLLALVDDDEATAVRAHACLLYAGIALMRGKAQDALDALQKIPERPRFAVDAGYQKMMAACALRQLRKYDEALAAARASVEHGPTPGRLLVLADAQKHAGHLDDARRTLLNLVDRDPGNATAWAQLAGYENLAGATAAGAAAFARFNDVAVAGADADRNAAFVFATLGDVGLCVAALERALVQEPVETRGYIDDEIELERFRGHPLFRRVSMEP